MVCKKCRTELMKRMLDNFSKEVKESRKFLKENNAKADKIWKELMELY